LSRERQKNLIEKENKKTMNKKFYCVLDTETANSVEQPLPYDLGFAIIDKQGKVYESYSFVIADIYCGHKDLMKSAYYAEKIPNYEADLKDGKRKLVALKTAQRTFEKALKKYNIKEVYAYNAIFDKKALNNDIRYITKSKYRWFFPYGIEIKCIMSIACDLLMCRPSYIKFCLENELLTEKGNISTTAETCYKYITKSLDFEEKHTGLEDVLIESEILAYCFRQKKKIDGTPKANCWMKVKKFRKEMNL
jgi:hypothetical protein